MAIYTPASPALVKLFTTGYNKDPVPNKILTLIGDAAKYCREISLAELDKYNKSSITTQGFGFKLCTIKTLPIAMAL
jgi:hypothetical protein